MSRLSQAFPIFCTVIFRLLLFRANVQTWKSPAEKDNLFSCLLVSWQLFYCWALSLKHCRIFSKHFTAHLSTPIKSLESPWLTQTNLDLPQIIWGRTKIKQTSVSESVGTAYQHIARKHRKQEEKGDRESIWPSIWNTNTVLRLHTTQVTHIMPK